MGGASFPTYNIPRLNHNDYNVLRDSCIATLKQFYEQVICPPEGPSKKDHGDVDLLVCKPRSVVDNDALMASLGAVDRTSAANLTVSFAVPFPGKDSRSSNFAQIDVHRCNEGFLEWECFMASYGDLVQILGVLNRGIGLTMNDKGLNVRIPELEATNRKAAMLHLTLDVSETMRFLGLDHEKFQRGFDSDEDVYEWCVSGQFYGQLDKLSQTANDRARLKKRPMFTKFLTEWLPAHPETWENRHKFTRTEVLEQAVKYFGVHEQYGQIISVWKARTKTDELLAAIKEVIPLENEGLGQVLKGLKRWTHIDQNGEAQLVDEGEGRDDIHSSPDWLSRVPEDKKAGLLLWVRANHQELRRREKDRSTMLKDQRSVDRRSEVEDKQ